MVYLVSVGRGMGGGGGGGDRAGHGILGGGGGGGEEGGFQGCSSLVWSWGSMTLDMSWMCKSNGKRL